MPPPTVGGYVYGQYLKPGERLRDSYELQNQRQSTEYGLLKSQSNLAKTASTRANWELQRDREAWDMQKSQAAAGSKLAGDFLSAWSSEIKDFKKMFTGGGSAGGGILGEIKGVSDKIGAAYDSFKTDYGPAGKEMIEGAREEAMARRGMVSQLEDVSKADYEGAEGRAAADVAGQSEQARGEMAREAMSFGIDPSAGQFGALTRKSFLDEARNTAVAMNQARRGEKERVAGTTMGALSVLDPSVSGKMGLDIANTGTRMLEAQAGVQGQYAGVADIYRKGVMEPMGTMAGYQLGKNVSATPPGGTTGIPDLSGAIQSTQVESPTAGYKRY